jgi:hypothetical protein
MVSTLLALIAVASGGSQQPDQSAPDALLSYFYRPEIVRQWQEEAVSRCAAASFPLECRPAFLSARYSEAAVAACREVAALEFQGQHGGTATSYAQRSMEQTCRSSTEYCRTAWLNYDRTYWRGKPSEADPRRLEHMEAYLTQTCRV